MKKRAVLVTFMAVLAVSSSACTNSEHAAPLGGTTTMPTAPPNSSAAAPTSPAPVVRDILDTDPTPPGADGRTLSLVRYTIPAGTKLAPHTHPGVQMASIASGTLSYTVVSGTAQVRRAGATAQEPVTGPQTTELKTGDAVIEGTNMVHFGENKTKEPVVILATLLTTSGQELAVPAPAGAPG